MFSLELSGGDNSSLPFDGDWSFPVLFIEGYIIGGALGEAPVLLEWWELLIW